LIEEAPVSDAVVELARRFQRFGERECLPASPLYARLAIGIASDPELLELALAARAQPVPNLFFGAVHYLLLKGLTHPLARFYPDLSGSPITIQQHEPFPSFRAFCLEHAAPIAEQLATRRVQTNEVRRCACLLPAFALAARRAGDRPLALIEIGASAGLNLLWDRYAYHYGGGRWCGDPASPVQLRCTLRGTMAPPLPKRMPKIAWRYGIDLNPIDVRDQDAVLWLRALIWPEQTDRAEYLRHALILAEQTPPPIHAGDAVALLPDLLRQVPEESTLCLYHTFTINQFPALAREQLQSILTTHAATRDFVVTSIEWQEPAPPLVLTTFSGGVRSVETLGRCDPHGAWLEWIAEDDW
jgi:hypothetical protein